MLDAHFVYYSFTKVTRALQGQVLNNSSNYKVFAMVLYQLHLVHPDIHSLGG